LNADNVFFTATGTCDSPILSIEIIVILRRDNAIVSIGRLEPQKSTFEVTETKSLLTPCITGTYQGDASMTFVVPAGYDPPAIELNPQSDPVFLSCL
jgi:uncharacterized protein YjlB